MQKPPVRPKPGVPPIGRTRASDAQKLLTPQKKTAPASALRRAGASSAAYAFGTPLSHQVKIRGSVALRNRKAGAARLSPSAIGSGFALPSLLLLLGGVNGFFVAATACVLFGCGHTLARTLQNRRHVALLAPEIDLAAQFDRFVEQSASRLPEEAVALLQDIKAALSQILPRLGAIRKQGTLGAEDIFFIEQTILRYLPDTCAPFFAIPADRHDLVLLNRNQTPKQALLEQFGMIATKLQRLHDELVKTDADQLNVQQRFLADKTAR